MYINKKITDLKNKVAKKFSGWLVWLVFLRGIVVTTMPFLFYSVLATVSTALIVSSKS
jgi:hypothetical protein